VEYVNQFKCNIGVIFLPFYMQEFYY